MLWNKRKTWDVIKPGMKLNKYIRRHAINHLILSIAFVAVGAGRALADLAFGTPANLGPVVNSSSREDSPCISADGLSLYFQSNRPGSSGTWDIWVTTRETVNDRWGEPTNLGSTVNSSAWDFAPSITASGELCFSSFRSGGYGDVDSWVTTRANASEPWGKPVNLGPELNGPFGDQVEISFDGLTATISSDRPGGHGGMDIWTSTRPSLGDEWSQPVNLGPEVNSSGWDMDTAISADNRLFFFTSPRSGGFGGDDLWVMTRATANDAWSTPVNLGPKINTSYHDSWPGISYDGTTLYFCSNRPGGSGAYDLWQVPILSTSKAHNPKPDDGTLNEATWISLAWSPGHTAVSRDVYFGDNFDDVNDGTGGTFQGNQDSTVFIAGFSGFAFPDGLTPGTVYYWRVDEINEAEPDSPLKGDVWSFQIPPRAAWEPVPADSSRFVESEPTLSWTPGFGAKLHTVYFGENFDEVNDSTGGIQQPATAFAPHGPLEPDMTYYWRVDEFDTLETHRGDVWSFTTAGEGGGIKGEYFNDMDFNTLVLTRIDPQINFNWGSGRPDPLIGQDSFSVRWTGQIEAAFTETYTFYTTSDDGVRLWVDGKRLVENWTTHSSAENAGKINLFAGQTYSLVLEYYEDWGDAVAQLHWESPSTPKQLIPAAAMSFLANAYNPSPANGTADVELATDLTWKPGEYATSHEVYFGTDEDAVANATKSSPEYKGCKALGDEILDPGELAVETTYFWRVDGVTDTHPDSPWIGDVWKFSTGSFLVGDNVERHEEVGQHH